MIYEKAGREKWRRLKVGEVGIFTLPSYKAIESARVAVSQLKKLEGMDFERLKVNEPLTIAFKRIK